MAGATPDHRRPCTCHYAQARLFFESQSPVEQGHSADAFRFELSKVSVPAIRVRTVAMLRNASEAPAQRVAAGLCIDPMRAPLPRRCPVRRCPT